jgi:endonuclease G
VLSADFRELVDVVAQMMGVCAGTGKSGPLGDHDAAAIANKLAQQTAEIVGGWPTSEFPECCCIGSVDGTGSYFCSGTLIAPNVVLTAGHCTEMKMQRVLFGSKISEPKAKVVGVKSVIPYPDYTPPPMPANDLCLLILEKDAPVAPVSIATTQQLAAASEVHLVGFGYNDPVRPYGFGTKRHVNVDITYLQRTPEDDLSEAEQQLGFRAAYEFVAGRKNLGRDSCQGDSGGPAYIYVQNRFVVAGVTSRATLGSVECGDGGVYVRPDRFADWIQSVVVEAGSKDKPPKHPH